MLPLPILSRPLIAAPMAGGPSTPELAVAVSRGGGLGFLAAGYLRAEQLGEQLALARALAPGEPLGVNLFVPRRVNCATHRLDEAELHTRASAVTAFAQSMQRAGLATADPSTLSPDDDDDWDAKISLLLSEGVELVSFTFGCPERAVLDAFHAAGIPTAVTVTDEIEAVRARAVGASALVVQGTEAGGHRGTHREAKHPNGRTSAELLRAILPLAGERPVIVAGGIARRRHVRGMLEAGAWAVQLGTALLLADEAGTHPVHRAALESERFNETVLTRAFSGRWARSLKNEFLDQFSEAPAAYPEVNQLTAPMKAAARERGDGEHLHLWAGTEWRRSRAEPAARILHRLDPGSRP